MHTTYNESVTSKQNFAVSRVVATFYGRGKVSFHYRSNDLHVKAENERFSAVGQGCYQNLKYENFHVVVYHYVLNYSRIRAHVECDCFLAQLIKSLVRDVVVIS